MDKRRLGHSDVMVSRICLGTMTWGNQNSEREAFRQMDMALDHGVNFFDTAELYPIPPEARTQGRTEQIIGNWLKKSRRRQEIILATKVCGRSSMNWFRRDGSPCELSESQIREAVEGSLRRLGIDHVDLYQLHWPDRPMRLFGGLGFEPYEGESHDLEETLMVMGKLIEEGKIRLVGLSNETPWGVMRCLQASQMLGLPRIVSVQNAYHLLNRTYETGLSEISYHEGVGLLAYSPLAQGYLTGKYLYGRLPRGSRKQLFGHRLERYETPGSEDATAKYVAIARRHGLDPAQMAISFVASRFFTTSTIIGATSESQLETALEAIEISLDDEVLKEIEQVHLIHSNPCP